MKVDEGIENWKSEFYTGRWGKTSVHTWFNFFLKILTGEAGRLFQCLTILSSGGGSYLGVPFR